MSDKKNRYLVKIGKRKLAIVTDKSESHVDRVASLVQRDLEEIDKRHGASSPTAAALLSALNEASDYVDQLELNRSLQDENANLQAQLDELENQLAQLKTEKEEKSQGTGEKQAKKENKNVSKATSSSKSSTQSKQKQNNHHQDPFKQENSGLSKTPRK